MIKSALFYQRVALIVGIGLMAVKFAAWQITQSNAILSDALESIVNVVASGFALFSLSFAHRPKDSNHPYGHGKVEFISVGLEGMLIISAGLFAIGKGIYNFYSPTAISNLPMGIGLTALAGLINYLLARLLITKGSQISSKSMQADGHHLLTDVYSSLGMLAGLALVFISDIIWLDSLLAILVGLLILKTGYTLMRDSVAGIMDETDEKLIADLVAIVNNKRQPDWIDLHNLRVQRFGRNLHLDGHLTLPYYYSLQQAHDRLEEFTQTLQENHPQEVEFFIHSDPCEPPKNCQICTKTDCQVRKAPFQKEITWTLKNTLINKKHHIATPQ